MLLIILIAVLLQGAVSEIYWYPIGLLVVIAFGLSLLGWEQGWLNPPKLTGLEPYFFAWITMMILSGLFSSHRWISIFALERFLISLLFFYLVLWHFENRSREKILLWFLFLFPALISLLGIGLHFFNKSGSAIFTINLKCVSGTLVNHNNFAGLIILCFFLGAGLMMSLRRKSSESLSEDLAKRIIVSFPLLILLLALAFSFSRGGWIAFGLAAIGFSLWLAIGSRGKKFKAYLAIILGIVMLGALLSLILERDALRARAQTLNEFFVDPASGLDLTGRKMLWQSTLKMIRDHPGLGIGPGAFWAEYPNYRILGELHGESHSHNDLLQLAAESGIPSALIFLALLVQAVRLWLKNYRTEMARFERRVSASIIFGIFGFLFQDQFDFHFHIPGLVYYFLALAAFLLKPRGRGEGEDPE